MPESLREFSITLSLCSFNCKLAASSSCCWILISSIALTSPPFSFDTGKQVPIPKMQICLSQWGKLFCFGFRCNNLLHLWSEPFSCFPVKQQRNYYSTKEENRSELPIVSLQGWCPAACFAAKEKITHCPWSFLRSFGRG
jgi:hypothetical protein